MSDIIYLRLSGERQGNISAGCGSQASIGNRYQVGHEDEIMCLSLIRSVTSSGSQVNHHGLQFTKMIDKSTPLLLNAINDNEALKLTFDFYRINRFGKLERYYYVELRGAYIQYQRTSISVDDFASETIRVSYEYIRCKHLTANTEYSDLLLPDHYNQLFPPQKVVAPLPEPPSPVPEIVLILGIFFDGTGNNAVNTQNMLEVFKAGHYQLSDPDAASILEKSAAEMGMSGTEAGSYLGYYTNIHWLNMLYDNDLPNEKGVIQQGIYIEGIGTEEGKPDDVLGLGLGISDTGVIAKTDKAVGKIAGAIVEAMKDLSDRVKVRELKFDIFGFSRGAAAARHFANRIQSEDPAIVAAIRKGLAKFEYTGAPAGKTRFIGIMDTVAAIGTPINGLNPHSANTGSVNIRLRPGVAEKVFHITALHECRFNFALNSVSPAWPELALPGTHSDIGGGYLPVMRESVFLTRPQGETVRYSQPDNETRIYHQTCEQKSRLALLPTIAPLIRTQRISTESWSMNSQPPNPQGQLQKRSFAALIMLNRIVRNDWANVVLRVMLEAAKEAGVKFLPIDPTKPIFELPGELLPWYQKALAQGKAVRSGRFPVPFLPDEIDAIARKYIHCSANWNTVQIKDTGQIYGETQATQIFGFINRPDENWRRTIYNMDGKNR